MGAVSRKPDTFSFFPAVRLCLTQQKGMWGMPLPFPLSYTFLHHLMQTALNVPPQPGSFPRLPQALYSLDPTDPHNGLTLLFVGSYPVVNR